MTAHNHANKDEIAKVVLMPGDPARAKWIAETFLKDPKLVNNVRGMLCFTGTYKNKTVSVMGHGMGIPSIGIYSHELYSFYDVQTIIRIGSTGAYTRELEVNDVVLVKRSYSDSTYPKFMGAEVGEDKFLYPTPAINELILKTAEENNLQIKEVTAHASDVFYNNDYESLDQLIKRTSSDCVEMETTALFANAQVLQKNAACLLTVSDSLVTGDALSPEERQTTFKNMVKLALNTAIKLV